MNPSYQDEIIALSLGGQTFTPEECAKKHDVTEEKVYRDIADIKALGRVYRQMPSVQPSQLSINKINVHAREYCDRVKQSFWHRVLKPVPLGSLALMMIVAFGATQYQPAQTNVAQNEQPTVLASHSSPVVPGDSKPVNQILNVLVQDPAANTLSNATFLNPTFKNNAVRSVSVNKNIFPNIDREFKQRYKEQKLTNHDVDTVFHRARKLEKHGFVKEALKDYLFLAKFYRDQVDQKALPLAMARCYQSLGRKDVALTLLNAFETGYGEDPALRTWEDQLKSETF